MNPPPPFFDPALIQQLTPMPALIGALKAAFAQRENAPLRQTYELPSNAKLLLMPAWRRAGDAGVKIVTIQSNASPAVRATYLLLDGFDGHLKALMDGATLTLRRTAAASALAADMLARKDARHLLMIGTGALAPHLIEAHRSIRPLDRVSIWGRDLEKARALATKLTAAGVDTRAVTDRSAAVKEADIVSSATLATSPLVLGEWLQAGAHVDLVGAFRPTMCEADPTCFARGRVFVDTREGVLDEAGDVLQAIAAGALTPDAIESDLEGLCCGSHAGRGADPEAITVFKSVGTAIEDLAAAELVFETWQHREFNAQTRTHR